MATEGPFLRVLELARALHCSRNYIWAMKRDGFVMPGRRATVAEARQWLRERPDFRVNKTIVSRCEHL